jgi:predicted RNA-binding Zn ribbon-like protein
MTPAMTPAGQGAGAGLALSAAAGTWDRLKICAAPDCRWVFYDVSRNGAGRWCSMRSCGNRDKTRTYRQRHAAAG